MKKLFLALISVASFTTALPAFAGPDWQVIEHGRKVKTERMRQEQARQAREAQQKNLQQPYNPAEKDGMMKACIEMMARSKQQLDQ